VGGLAHDIPPGFVEKTYEFLDAFDTRVAEYNQILTGNKIFIERTADVGVMTPEVAINYGVSGPSLRASGVNIDIRRTQPYSIYDRFEFDVPLGEGAQGTVGDSWDRYWVRVREMEESAKIIRQALDQLPVEGDVKSAIPRRIRPPKGEVYSRSENPRGDLGYYVVSNGKNVPLRVKMRSPAFSNLSVINEIGQGWMISDVIAILGSLDIVLGEIDR
jgi:NADH-quinone oxidoreductase subunit D